MPDSNKATFTVQPGGSLAGQLRVPGDKSISHRSIMLGSLAEGVTEVSGFLEGDDSLATLAAFRAMGVSIEGPSNGQVTVHGVGLHGLQVPVTDLDVGNDQIWSPDGKWIVFTMEKEGEKTNLYRIPSDFSGKAERLTTSENAQHPTDISPDGRLLAITVDTKERESDILLLRLDEQGHVVGESYAICESPTWDFGGRFSPDGQWISYSSRESGDYEVYVKTTSGSGAAIQVSTEGGFNAGWSPTENKLYFTKKWLADEVYVVSFTVEGGIFKPSLPELVFKLEGTNLSPRNLEVAPDGKQFLITVQANAAPDVWTNPKIIVNWFEDLKTKVPIE